MFGAYRVIAISMILAFGSIFAFNFEQADAQLCFAPTCTTGDIFVADSSLDTISKYDSSGTPINLDFLANMDNAVTVALDSAGNIYAGIHTGSFSPVGQYDNAGTELNPNFISTLDTLHSIAFDSAGNIYASFTATGQAKVQKFSSTGSPLDADFITDAPNPIKIKFDSSDNLYVVSGSGNTIRQYDISGNLLNADFAPKPGALATWDPTSVAFDSSGNLYVSDNVNNRVIQFSSTGSLLDVNFADGMLFPRDIAFDSDGNLYVADSDIQDTIRKYDSSGNIIANTFIGGLADPRAIAFDTMQNPVGSISIPLDSTSLLVAGNQMNSIWITLTIAAAIGIGTVLITKRSRN